jgi:hypothetical protein
MELWQNDTDTRKLRYWKKNFSRRQLVPHKSHKDWPYIESILYSERLATDPMCNGTDRSFLAVVIVDVYSYCRKASTILLNTIEP